MYINKVANLIIEICHLIYILGFKRIPSQDHLSEDD